MGKIGIWQSFLKEKLVFDYNSKKTIEITMFIIMGVNALSSIFPPINKFFLDNNIYLLSIWAITGLVIAQIIKIRFDIENLSKRDFKKLNINKFTHTKLQDIIREFKSDDNIHIFFGFNDFKLFNELIQILNQYKFNNVNLYATPPVIDKLSINAFEYYNIYLIDGLDFSIALFSMKGKEINKCLFVTTKDDTCSINNEYCCLQIKDDRELISPYEHIYFKYFTENSLKADSDFMVKAISYILFSHKKSISSIYKNRYFKITTRNTFYNYIIDIMNNAKKSLIAVDFIQPRFWIEDDLTNKYAYAHSKTGAIKKRIHIYNTNDFLVDIYTKEEVKDYYLKYIELMQINEVELYFLNETNINKHLYEMRGSLAIDNECVFIAINPQDGISFGEFDFNEDIVNYYLDRFNDFYKKSLTTEEFIKIMEVI